MDLKPHLKPYRKVNIKRVEHMIGVFQKLPEQMINLSTYVSTDKNNEPVALARTHSCGTVACLAGHVALTFAPKSWLVTDSMFTDPKTNKTTHASDLAARFLGIDKYEDGWLFSSSWSEESEREEAIQRLRKLLRLAKKAQGVK